KAGIPRHVPALVVQRLCGSGLQAIISAAQSIMLGEGDYMLAGGAESMSQAPHVIYGARWGFELGGGKLEDALWSALVDSYNGLPMALTAENLATRYGISREQQDEFAYLSQQRTKAAQEAGRLAEEIVPVTVRDKRGKETLIERDEHPRPDTTIEALARLKPRFKAEGSVTAGNASGINDAGAAVVVAAGEAARVGGQQPLARLLAWGIVGVDPDVMGIGPAPAIRQALQRAGLQLSDIDLFEINEAFAAQYIAVERELGLDRKLVNVNGGAIALGHPLAASGTRISLSLLYEMRRRHARYGVAALCIGGGQGIAAVYENLQR
ncbi:MAG: acetyl-CoA C-acyltransferase, partial [Candidatus Chloroheliales bacterium]